ncbi:alpha/beta-hydrolase [Pleomassaria siparia CBS 279.74]|uniref:Carboxylic ester hydrolase n=1 Tax=Pleomassaria siparia CBS 279.74 TaxID=1314801 RepID=A0A6G1K7X0_9PLEO|nr:alpha/beta-hydrolase [Pleomassaria siparia CBS 279.74]
MLFLIILFLALCVQETFAVDLLVDLGYSQYLGVDQGDGVNRWAGMRFARSVSRLDGMRFAAPMDPIPVKGIVNASDFGPICIGSGTNLKFEFGDTQSEDCLFANVFAPANATTNSSLPVYVFVQGGGFNMNGNANYNGGDLINAADGQMVVVNFNYRVGPYGFMASKEISDDPDTSLNNGLKDQRQLLKWVKTHIREFGGNPDHVTLGGVSAGAASVVLQLTAHGGRDDKLFHAVAAESQAFPPIRNVTEMQWAFDALLKKTDCADLACLRNLDAVSFQTAVRTFKVPFPGGKNPPLYFWNPTLDFDFVKDYTYNEVKAGHFVKVPTIFGDTTNEGLGFTPSNINSLSKAEQFVKDQFPNIDNADDVRIRSVWHGSLDPRRDPQWRNIASDVYGHIRYICPGLNLSHTYAEISNGTSVPTWNYRWNVGKALHVAEVGSIWHNSGASAASAFVQNYFISFIRSYDPNKYSTNFTSPSGETISSPKWLTFSDGVGRRMLLSNDNQVGMEQVSQLERNRCNAITDMGLQLEQVPSTGSRVSSTWPSAYLTYLVLGLFLLQYICP